VTDGSNYRITLEGLELTTDTTFFSDQSGQGADIVKYYLFPVGTGRYAKVTFIDIISNDTLGVHQFRVANLPDPTFYWGGTKQEQVANIREKRVYAKYPPEILLNAYFRIKSCELYIDSNSVFCPGNDIQPAEKILDKVNKDSTITMKIVYIGPDKITRLATASWNVNAWIETKAPNVENIID
jgi:hypothetical protein